MCLLFSGHVGLWHEIHIQLYFSVRCPNLCNPNNGAVDFNDTTVGFVATYTCNEGFTRNGPANRDCQENGTWSHSEPICMPDGKYTYCQDIVLRYKTSLILDSTEHGIYTALDNIYEYNITVF